MRSGLRLSRPSARGEPGARGPRGAALAEDGRVGAGVGANEPRARRPPDASCSPEDEPDGGALLWFVLARGDVQVLLAPCFVWSLAEVV